MKKLNIPDWFSIYRIIMAPVIIIIAVSGEKKFTGILLAVSFATDAIDGFLARKLHIESKHGARLDSSGDALTFLAGAIAIIIFETDFVLEHIWPVSIALGLYFTQLIYGIIKYGRPSSFHTLSAKTAAIVQGLFIISVFFIGIMEWLFYTAIVISLIETIEEIILIYKLDKWQTNVKGLYWLFKKEK